MRMTSTVAGIL
jgi:antitoxin ParD1/3/4